MRLKSIDILVLTLAKMLPISDFLKFCLFVCYDLRPDMFQSHELAVVITHTIGSIYSNLCVLAVSSMH